LSLAQDPELFNLQVKTQATLEKLKTHLKEDKKSRLKDEQQVMMLELKVRSDLTMKKLKEQLKKSKVCGW